MDSVKLRNRTLIRLIARLGAAGFRLLYRTCRVHVVQQAPLVSPYTDTGDERYVYCVWHDGILGAIFSGPQVRTSALTSRHADGEYVAEIIQAVGMKPVRGSSGHGGAGAVRRMMSDASEYHVVIATDGPRGPRRVVKPGIIFLASQSGRRIVPVATSAVRGFRPKGKWTDLLIPRPLTTAYTIGGIPLSIPSNLSSDQLEPWRVELQKRMDALQQLADEMAGHTPAAAVEAATSKAA